MTNLETSDKLSQKPEYSAAANRELAASCWDRDSIRSIPSAPANGAANYVLGDFQIDGTSSNAQLNETKVNPNVLDYTPIQTSKNSFNLGVDYVDTNDQRTLAAKFSDFAVAAASRASDGNGWKSWAKSEATKLAGIGEGLTEAKDDAKAATSSAWKSLNDGTVANFLAKPNAINEPVFATVSGVVDSMSKDSSYSNKILEGLGKAISEASESYSRLPDSEKGKVIGKSTFGMVNIEGSTEAAEAALNIANRIAQHIEPSVIQTIEKTVLSMRGMTPQLAEDTNKMLVTYIESKGLTTAELEQSGCFRKGYFENLTGAGGSWEPVEGSERYSKDVLLQIHEKSCLSACGEMLTDGQVKQPHLMEEFRKYWPKEMQNEDRAANISWLAKELGPEWRGGDFRAPGLTQNQKLDWLVSHKAPFCAELHEGGPEAHAIIVDGFDNAGNIRVRDSYHATRYEMTRQEFFKYWNERVAYKN